MNDKCDNSNNEYEYKEILIENGKLLLTIVNTQERISNLENQWIKCKCRYKILDFFLIFNAIDIMMKSIFGIGIAGCIVCIYRYIVSLF